MPFQVERHAEDGERGEGGGGGGERGERGEREQGARCRLARKGSR